jgi:outer membrane protein assembly factor BamD (BamD/ComL family)
MLETKYDLGHVSTEALWLHYEAEAAKGVDVARCEAAATPDACAEVEAFLSDFPNGAHRAAAEQALAVGKQKFKDEQAWAIVDVASCQKPKTSQDCYAVRAYLTAYPDGRHAAEANALLASVKNKLAALEAAEKVREEAQARADARAAEAAERAEKARARAEERAAKARCERCRDPRVRPCARICAANGFPTEDCVRVCLFLECKDQCP